MDIRSGSPARPILLGKNLFACVLLPCLAGCAHQQSTFKQAAPISEAAAATKVARFGVLTERVASERAVPVESSFDPSSSESSARSALSAVREEHCPFGKPVPRQGIDFGPTESVWRPGYELLHSADLKTPYWVCESYTRRSLVRNVERGSTKFKADPELQLAHAVPEDYAGSSAFEIDIGHMAPAEAHTSSRQRMLDTFYLSNSVPQNRSINRGMWAQIEECARLSTSSAGKAWIVSGPIHYTENDAPLEYIGDHVIIPTYTWKIVVVQASSGSLTSWAVVTPNEKLAEGWKFEDFKASIDDIELATGFDFMPGLPKSIEASLESTTHDVTCG